MKIIGSKLYAVCERCGNVIRVNKPIIGALHLCDYSDEDLARIYANPETARELRLRIARRRDELERA